MEQIIGTVERVVFQNADNGWTVLDVQTEEELVKAVGILPTVRVGETVRMTGSWTEHQTFGRQFRAQTCEQEMPQDADAILRYLSSGAVKGVGPAIAMRMMEKFGTETLQILETAPERLAEVQGISRAKAKQIGEDYVSRFGLREVLLAFSGYGLTSAEALRCYKRFGAQTVETVRSNPYILCSSGLRIPFERADALAREMHCSRDDDRRVEAGILHILRHNLGNGHTCLPQDKLAQTDADLLGVSVEQVQACITAMLLRGEIRSAVIDGNTRIFLNAMYRAEKEIAVRIREAARKRPPHKADVSERLAAIERNNGITYEEKQRDAVYDAVELGLLILTGGPGTGKTTTLRAIITMLESYGEAVVLAAPTGRAAKRMTELTGFEAKTIHRLLEVQWDDQDDPVFARNEQNPLDADAVVIDELSMVDVPLFHSLLMALKPGCRLIMVGDTHQLPAVGAGAVLSDLIDSGVVRAVELTQVFRQAMESRIVQSAHAIVAGEMPPLDCRDGDFFFLKKTDDHAVSETLTDLCMRRLPEHYGVSVAGNLQVLCPGRKGALGTVACNARLQQAVNPASPEKPEIRIGEQILRLGDKVMHTKNNYNIEWTRGDETGTGVFNGDIGVLVDINKHAETLTVRYDDREALYTRQDAMDLELAYAVTVHKSQGSEFDAVVMPVFRPQPLLCYRNLLYTAVTRARQLLILIGDAESVERMVQNDRKTLRYTGLKAFLEMPQEEMPW